MSLVSWWVSNNAFKTKEYIYKEGNCKQISEDCENITSITAFKIYIPDWLTTTNRKSPKLIDNENIKQNKNKRPPKIHRSRDASTWNWATYNFKRAFKHARHINISFITKSQ